MNYGKNRIDDDRNIFRHREDEANYVVLGDSQI